MIEIRFATAFKNAEAQKRMPIAQIPKISKLAFFDLFISSNILRSFLDML